MNLTTRKKQSLLILLFSALLFPFALPAQHHDAHEHADDWQEEIQQEEYNAGKQILAHVTDAYDWHIMDIGDKHISIPLPVILFDRGQWFVFMSSEFHHGHTAYKGFEIAHEGPHEGKIVAYKPDGTAYRPLDLSISKHIFAIFINSFIVVWIFIAVARAYRRREGSAPKGLQSLVEPLIIFIRDDVAKSSIGKNYERYTPYLLTIFFFIFISNLLGLVPFFPGGANVTGSLFVTVVLAAFTFVITTFSGNRNYWVHIVNTPGVPWWLKVPVPLMPVVELIGVFTKPIVLAIRLFANITAGHIILLSFISLIFIFGQLNEWLGMGVSLISLVFAIFMNLLELLVAFIQAYVFTLLSAIYFGLATEENH